MSRNSSRCRMRCGIDLRRIDETRLILIESAIFQCSKETGSVSFMARGTYLFDEHQDRIRIAVDSNLDDFLAMSTFLSFAPEFAARSTVVRCVSGAARFLKSFTIDPSQHKNLMGACVLCDRGQKTVSPLGEIRLVPLADRWLADR